MKIESEQPYYQIPIGTLIEREEGLYSVVRVIQAKGREPAYILEDTEDSTQIMVFERDFDFSEVEEVKE